MNTYQERSQRDMDHQPRWLVIIRLLLGVLLFAKGISFMNNASVLKEVLSGTSLSNDSGWLQILITWMNLLGGLFLILGIQTRIVAILELPLIIGAIFFINTQKGLFGSPSELIIAVFVLALLIFFIIKGGGPLSLDNYWNKNKGHASGTRLP